MLAKKTVWQESDLHGTVHIQCGKVLKLVNLGGQFA